MTQLGEAIAIGLLDPTPDPLSDETITFDEQFQFVDHAGEPLGPARYEVLKSDGSRLSGVSDDQGRLPRVDDASPLVVRVRFLGLVRST
ncbi:hypothetical protein RA210_U240048 [Rubrivivax sp. A210]|uniref:hypothetical protein n=1 Tax=Rubrivivax sp. A210 TaxID=2772301 RepID=UPI0019183BC7|nr:hypothetical protein [Rubrivivax sp. A210]CAD5372901.1 hypothetical protein RA210_U240048 [Rubrivivax sp. A210]